ncbi:hypothetical protein DAMA08_008440 [Martiniozyma asiatica (nom. inval.)]|nr:hypothetical protein DAMA08_008440 [Martiniozyma asiatica]
MRDIVIFSGSSNPNLVSRICNNLSLPQGKVLLKKFANGETSVQLETSVREKDVFILQTGAGKVNDYLIELLLMISACKMASAKRITVILPLFFYSRQPDVPGVSKKRVQTTGELGTEETTFNGTYRPWVAQNGMLIASMIETAGANHIVTMDLHDAQFQGFFNIPVDNLFSKPLVQHYITNYLPRDCVIVSPDAGGAKRAAAVADSLYLNFALVDRGERNMLVGDVEGKNCVIVDDLADTANTLIRAASMLKEQGAADIYAIVTHGVFSDNALKKSNGLFKKIITSNSVDQQNNTLLEVLDVSRMFSEAIRRINNGESVSMIYNQMV